MVTLPTTLSTSLATSSRTLLATQEKSLDPNVHQCELHCDAQVLISVINANGWISQVKPADFGQTG
jgi:hypothetical protein